MRPEPAIRNRWLLVAGTGIGVFMAQLDATIVGVALPSIQYDLRVSTNIAAWVVLGYVLPLIAMTLPSGRWLDTVGQRPALIFSVSGFAAASVVAGMSPGGAWLIGARLLQGVFGAVLFALLPVLTTGAVRPSARGRAMGLVMTLGTLGAVSGPLLGGYLVEAAGWRWIFYANIPVSVLVIAIGVAQIPRGGRLRSPDRAWVVETALLGTAAVAGMLALTFAVEYGPGWLALALVAAPFLRAWSRLPGSRQVRGLLRVPDIAAPHLALLTGMAATMIVLFLAPFYLQGSLRASPSVVGYTILGFPAAVILLGPIGGALADRWGTRRTAITGALVAGVGLVLIVPLGDGWTPIDLAWRLAVLGAGVGLFGTATQTMAMGNAPRQQLGTAAASMSLARQLATAIGPAVATTIWALSGYTLGGMRGALLVAVGLGLISALTMIVLRSSTPDRGGAPPPRQPAGITPRG